MKAFMGDGAFDDKEIFDYCDENNIQPIIKIRKGASPKSGGSRLRRKCIRELEKIGQEPGMRNMTTASDGWSSPVFSCKACIWRECKRQEV